jgi:exonuclease-1
MGVKGLSKFVKKYGVTKTLEDYKDKTFAIDSFIYIYKFKFLGSIEFFLTKQIFLLREQGINPLYVFDGPKKPIQKKETSDKRKESNGMSITQEDIQQFKDVITSQNLKYIVAPSEGEKMCSYLVQIGKADIVLSNDYDCLAFDCGKFLSCMNEIYTEYDSCNLLENEKLTRHQFTTACIMSGTDYYQQGVKGYGLIKALKYIRSKETYSISNVSDDQELLSREPIIQNIFCDFSEEKETLDVFNLE